MPAVHLRKGPPCGLPIEAGKRLEPVRPFIQSLMCRNRGFLTRPRRCGLDSNCPSPELVRLPHVGWSSGSPPSLLPPLRLFCLLSRFSLPPLPSASLRLFCLLSVSSSSSLASRLGLSPGCVCVCRRVLSDAVRGAPSLPLSCPSAAASLLSLFCLSPSPSPSTCPSRTLEVASFLARPSGSTQARN